MLQHGHLYLIYTNKRAVSHTIWVTRCKVEININACTYIHFKQHQEVTVQFLQFQCNFNVFATTFFSSCLRQCQKMSELGKKVRNRPNYAKVQKIWAIYAKPVVYSLPISDLLSQFSCCMAVQGNSQFSVGCFFHTFFLPSLSLFSLFFTPLPPPPSMNHIFKS